MPASPNRRRSEEVALLALFGASVGAAAWLTSRWRERAQRWQWAREISRGLALPIEGERHNGQHHNGHHHLVS
jgi:hypothetical protein